MKKTTLILIALSIALSACNTFHGIGQDIESAGEAISGSATKTKHEMTK